MCIKYVRLVPLSPCGRVGRAGGVPGGDTMGEVGGRGTGPKNAVYNCAALEGELSPRLHIQKKLGAICCHWTEEWQSWALCWSVV